MNFRHRLSNQQGRPRGMLIWTFEGSTDRTVVFPSNVHINILLGLPCRLESLCLKFTIEPSIFIDGDLAESIKRSASDRLGDLVPQVRAQTSPGFFHNVALPGLCLELSFHVLYCRTQANPPPMHFAEPPIWPSSIRTEDPTCANHVT